MTKRDWRARGSGSNEIRALRRKLHKLQAELRAARRGEDSTGPAVSPLAPPDGFPTLPPIAGVRFAAAAAGVKYRNRTDVMLAEVAPGSSIAGVFTRSSTRSAPVLWCQEMLSKFDPDAQNPVGILVNSGNSNAFTGASGTASVSACTKAAAHVLGTVADRIFPASTGVIGEPLPHDRITAVLDDLSAALDPGGAAQAARAIMTTDTFPKGSTRQLDLGGKTVTISGFAKGSGMIAPDMATMLVYIFTDAKVDQALLQDMVSSLNQTSFNAITVDSDTSTSDTLLVAATGQAGNKTLSSMRQKGAKAFREALGAVMLDLAHQVVRDGEGATKFIQIDVAGAASDQSAQIIGRAIANSPLVKTAIAGEDPNWGRVVMAIGKSGEPADRDRISIHFGDVLVAENGWVSPLYREEQGVAHMKGDAINIRVGLGVGTGAATVWTCDLTHGYISINADYRS